MNTQIFLDRLRATGNAVTAIQATVLLCVIYILFVPFFAVRKLFMHASRRSKGWLMWKMKHTSLFDAQKQY